jgi:hypothetical protein
MIDHDEFYVGYGSGLPPGMRRCVIPAVIVAILGAVSVAAVFVSQQRALADSRFEFGSTHSFNGYLTLSPAPALLTVDRDGTQVHWLVASGKFGGAAALGAAQPGWITLSGSLIEREQWRMIQVVVGSLRRQSHQPPPPSLHVAVPRPVDVTGEIVDGKCYLGVMNPGERIVHRDCAVRCLEGGVPAMFAYRDQSGSHLALLLGASSENRTSDVGRSVRLSGMLWGPEHALVLSLSTAQ